MTCDRLYAIQIGVDGPIKIGQSHSPAKRLAALQGASPYALRIVHDVPNECGLERAIHAELRQHRLRGEWFANHPDVLATIELVVRDGMDALFPQPEPVEYAEVPDFEITRRTVPTGVIEAIGEKVVRNAFRLSRQRLYSWKKHGIPIPHRVAVAKLAAEHGQPVPPDFFKGMVS